MLKTGPGLLYSARRGVFTFSEPGNAVAALGLRRASSTTSKQRKAPGRDGNTAPAPPNNYALLLQLKWRAEELLLADVSEKRAQKKPRVLDRGTEEVFDVEWRDESLHKASVAGLPTEEERETLLCELLAVALNERCGRGVKGHFFTSFPTDDSIMMPPRATEAVVAPFSHQVHIWSEQRDWEAVVACAAKVMGSWGTQRNRNRGRTRGVGDPDSQLRSAARNFLKKLESLCSLGAVEPVGPLINERKRRLKRTQEVEVNKLGRDGSKPDATPNLLYRLALLFRLMDCLLRRREEEAGLAGEGRHLKDAVHCMLNEIEGRVFVVKDFSGSPTTLEGLSALILAAFGHNCGSGTTAGGDGGDEVRWRAYKGDLSEALLLLCSAYLRLAPARFLVCEAAFSAPGGKSHSLLNPNPVSVVRTMHQCWNRWKASIFMHGFLAALWWLRLVPPVLEALLDVTNLLNKNVHPNCAASGGESQAKLGQVELLAMLCEMLYFDEESYKERMALLSARKAVEGAVAGQADKCDSSLGDGGSPPVARGDDLHSLTRPRSGRSMLRKGQEGGVLLPSSAEAMRKSSRFSSRKILGTVKEDGTARMVGSFAVMGVAVNSPLFDLLATSDDAVSELSSFFAVDTINRSCTLENLWLIILAALRHLQRCRSSIVLCDHGGCKGDVNSGDNLTAMEGPPNGSAVGAPTVPLFVVVSLQRLANTLAGAILRLYELSNPAFLRDDNIRRTVSVAIVAGTQEMISSSRFYSDALLSNWWFRSGALCVPGGRSKPFASLEMHIMTLVALRTRCRGRVGWVKRSTKVALHCLSSMPLSPLSKQWAASLVVCNLRDVAFLLSKDGGHSSSPSSRVYARGTMVDIVADTNADNSSRDSLSTWARETFSALLSTLKEDAELALLCGYGGFIDALFEMHLRIGTDQEEMVLFGSEVLFKVNLPAVVASLSKSAAESNAETHAATCESALFVLAELSRFATWPNLGNSFVLRTDENGLLIHVAVYCLRHARRAGGKRPSSYGLPAPHLPEVNEMIGKVLATCGATVSFFLARGNRCSYLQILDLSNRLLPFSRLQPLYSGRESSCVSALQHFLRGSCYPLLLSPSSPSSLSTLNASTDNAQVGSSGIAGGNRLLEESLKRLNFMANTTVGAHILGYLVRFIDLYLREQERSSRSTMEDLGTTMTHSSSLRGIGEVDVIQHRELRESAMVSLASVEAAPLVLLDYMGYLSCVGSWAMVNWTFSLAETSLKIQKRHQLAVTTSVVDVAVGAILSQLRAVGVPPTKRIPSNMPKSLICLCDMMSESPVTLFGFDRGSPLQGILRHPSRGDYRTMLFALKQAVLLVQQASGRYRISVRSSTSNASGTGEDYGRNGAESERDDHGKERGMSYFSIPINERSPDDRRQLRLFLDCLILCFDDVLDAIRWCALQQDVLDEELRDVLLLELQTLVRVLRGCLGTVLLFSPENKQWFCAESAQLLWLSLCVISAIGKVVSVDYGRVCFTGSIMQSIKTLLGAVDRLVREHSLLDPVDGSEVGKKKATDDVQEGTATPLLRSIKLSVKTLLSDALMSRRLALRFGLGLTDRYDFTALATALRTLASAAARYEPAGRTLQLVWQTLCNEVVGSAGPSKRKGRRVRDMKESVSRVKVPSKEELRLLLESFSDLQNEVSESAASRQSKGRAADYVVEWACPDVHAILDSVVEDPNVLRTDCAQIHALRNCRSGPAPDDTGDKAERGAFPGEWTTALAGAVTAFMEMDAALLLEEGDKISNEEALDAFFRQCTRLHLSSTAVASNDACIAIPQTNKVMLVHFGCMMAIVERCTLAEIVAFPRGDVLFGSLHLFYRQQTPVPLEQLHVLWSRLGERWKEEFLFPDVGEFERQQGEFLLLVRRCRALFQPSERGVDAITFSEKKHHRQRGLQLRDSAVSLLAHHGAPPLPYDVELLPHDDFSAVGDSIRVPATVGRHLKGQLPFRVPLDTLFTILHDLPRAPRSEPPLEDFAKAVVTYVARQHVLLRERCDGEALNVLQFMPGRQQFSSRVYQRRRLPLACAHAPSVSGWFFDEHEGDTIKKLFANWSVTEDGGVGDSGVEGRDGEGNVVTSAEYGMFEYLRALCLYLHLLALTANVCHHFHILGSDADMTAARASGSVGGSPSRYGFEENDKDYAGWRVSRGKDTDNQQQDAGARLAERRSGADARQAEPDGVNSNILENILLHFMNVSLAAMSHADAITHRAVSAAVLPGCDEERSRSALFYADELRLMVAVAMQDSLRVLLREAPSGFSLARRVAHRIISVFSCEEISFTPLDDDEVGKDITGSTGGTVKGRRNGAGQGCDEAEKQVAVALSAVARIDKAELAALRLKRPELLLRSPTLLGVLTPSFFNEVLSQHVRNAISLTVTQVVASLRFYLRSRDARLGPLMSATASILSSTYIRNAALRLFCEELCGQIVEREDFRDALAPQTVASGQQGAVTTVPNEVLIPFLAAMAREDACVTKNALALVLHRAMSLRPDVFGQPPTEDRFSRLAIARRGSGISASPPRFVTPAPDAKARDPLSLGVSGGDVVLESPLGPGSSVADRGDVSVLEADFPVSGSDDDEGKWDEVAALSRFKANRAEQEITRTHKRALLALNLTLAEVMETAMHYATMRRLTSEEHRKATAMIRSADDSRNERVAAFRSATPAGTTSVESVASIAPCSSCGDEGTRNNASGTNSLTIAGYPDAALNIEEPTHFGVVMLHANFALRKIIHVSLRRLAGQQGPKTLCMMVEMLQEVDPKWHRGPNDEHCRQLDSMLVGTLRVLVARALACVDVVGGAGDLIGGGAGGVAMSFGGLRRTEQALYLVQHKKHNNHGGSSSTSLGRGKYSGRGVGKGFRRDLSRTR